MKYFNVEKLMKTEYDPITFTIKDFLPKGIFLFGGAPKIGKSWYCLDLGYAVATGGEFMGKKANQGSVLYLALEDTERRLKSRLDSMGIRNSENFYFSTKIDALGAGFAEKINEFIDEVPDLSLIIIDTFKYIENTALYGHGYQADYSKMLQLKGLALKHPNLSILIVTHLNKTTATDPQNSISGSSGLTGGTDGNFVLVKPDRNEPEAILGCYMRDIESKEINVIFNKETLRWQPIEGLTENQAMLECILDIVEEDVPITATEICEKLIIAGFEGITGSSIGTLLKKTETTDFFKERGVEVEFKRLSTKRLITFKKIKNI